MTISKRFAATVASGALIGGMTLGGFGTLAIAAPAPNMPTEGTQQSEIERLEEQLAQAKEALKQAEEALAAEDAQAPAKLAAAQKDVDAAQANVDAATAALEDANNKRDEAEATQAAAQQDLTDKEAEAEKAAANRDAAQKAYDDAVANSASDEEIAQLAEDVKQKQGALDAAKSTAQEAADKLDAAKKDAATAAATADTAQQKLDAASAAADEAEAAQEQAEMQRDEAQQAVDKARGAVAKATSERDAACAEAENNPEVQAAQQKLNEARAAQQQKQDALDTAKQKAQQVISDEQQGTAGFFRWLGDEKNDADAKRAHSLLTTGKYTSARGGQIDISTKQDEHGDFFAKTELNKDGDATTLKNLKASIDHIDRGNELRRGDGNFTGLTDLKINSLLMAGSQLQTNASNAVVGHRAHVIGNENLSWGRPDPYEGWYTIEKARYETEPYGPKEEPTTGHYESLVNGDFELTGFAVVNKPGTLYRIAHGQVFDGTLRMYVDNSAPSYTTDEYRALIGEYEQYLENGKKRSIRHSRH